MTLGQRLRDLRVADPYMSLRQMAGAISVPAAWWSGVEQDRIEPTTEVVVRAALALGTTQDEFDELITLLDQWVAAPPPDLTGSICTGRRLT